MLHRKIIGLPTVLFALLVPFPRIRLPRFPPNRNAPEPTNSLVLMSSSLIPGPLSKLRCLGLGQTKAKGLSVCKVIPNSVAD